MRADLKWDLLFLLAAHIFRPSISASSLCSHRAINHHSPALYGNQGEKTSFGTTLPANAGRPALFVSVLTSVHLHCLFVPVPRCSQKMLIYLNLFKWRWVAFKCREISQSSRSANTRAVPPHSPPIRPHRQLILTTGGQVCLRKNGGNPRNGSIIFNKTRAGHQITVGLMGGRGGEDHSWCWEGKWGRWPRTRE